MRPWTYLALEAFFSAFGAVLLASEATAKDARPATTNRAITCFIGKPFG